AHGLGELAAFFVADVAGPIPARSAGIRSVFEFAERIPRPRNGAQRNSGFGRRPNGRVRSTRILFEFENRSPLKFEKSNSTFRGNSEGITRF
ncbi:hypothetical protein, partial [Streptomyces sp. NRRL F-6676]|uniref:hypothetical protein n=1 Tax=Streptomyces sp. NRRL F-6676 TaxID=1463878 RepID=UPI001F45AFBE